MKNRLIICALLMVISSVMPLNAGKKKSKAKVRKPVKSEIRYKEIDNYDFLYDGTDFDADYSVSAINDLMDEAFSHIGVRYRSGSKGPSAFDCSGFTSYVYGKMNIFIGSSSRDQYAKNTPIKDSEMMTGDLVFFTSPGSGRGVGHVGIVVDVDPETRTFSFIHASTKEGVKVSQSTDGYYARRYIGVRRVKE